MAIVQSVPAVFTINIPFDDGSVICAQHESCCWIFSTVKAPFFPLTEDGYHPVSGNRQFGYRILENGDMEIYTQGVDRFLFIKDPTNPSGNSIINMLAYLMEKVAFSEADNLWSSFQNKIKSFVDYNGGSATVILPPTTLRPKINQELINILRSNNKIEYVPCTN